LDVIESVRPMRNRWASITPGWHSENSYKMHDGAAHRGELYCE
jgi:hypothetical protein